MNKFEKKLVKTVCRLAADNPAYLYNDDRTSACYYTRGPNMSDQPGCILGQALVKINPKYYNTLKEIDDEGGAGFGTVVERLGLSVSDEIVDKMDRVQNYQDRGYKWGEAVNKFLGEFQSAETEN